MEILQQRRSIVQGIKERWRYYVPIGRFFELESTRNKQITRIDLLLFRFVIGHTTGHVCSYRFLTMYVQWRCVVVEEP